MEKNKSMIEAAANLSKNPLNLPNDLKKILEQMSEDEDESTCSECYSNAPDWTRLTPNMPNILKEKFDSEQTQSQQIEKEPNFMNTEVFPKISVNESNNGFWKYNEDKIIKQLEEYLKSTYSQHYIDRTSNSKDQTLDKIKHNRREGFLAGNVTKYIDRYDLKGTPRADLFKILHYTILLINHLDLIENK